MSTDFPGKDVALMITYESKITLYTTTAMLTSHICESPMMSSKVPPHTFTRWLLDLLLIAVRMFFSFFIFFLSLAEKIWCLFFPQNKLKHRVFWKQNTFPRARRSLSPTVPRCFCTCTWNWVSGYTLSGISFLPCVCIHHGFTCSATWGYERHTHSAVGFAIDIYRQRFPWSPWIFFQYNVLQILKHLYSLQSFVKKSLVWNNVVQTKWLSTSEPLVGAPFIPSHQ